mmetsp:Transcript_51121/g.81082  ORF Transcript_51121/g.81082 Transcript_51121/m.81082 type:complete len:212 (+) Transcript_51121:53-688(+)
MPLEGEADVRPSPRLLPQTSGFFGKGVMCEVLRSPPKAPPPTSHANTVIRSNFDDVPEDFELPPGDVVKGQKYFKKYCAQCHSIYPDNRIMHAGGSQLGPTLFNIYGRASGMMEIQNKTANERVDGVLWMAGPLMNYMKNPRQLAQGNVQMNFRGIPDFQTRVDIIHYMKTLDWTNEKITAIPEKPSSFPPMRWYQNVMKGQPLKSPTQSA